MKSFLQRILQFITFSPNSNFIERGQKDFLNISWIGHIAATRTKSTLIYLDVWLSSVKAVPFIYMVNMRSEIPHNKKKVPICCSSTQYIYVPSGWKLYARDRKTLRRTFVSLWKNCFSPFGRKNNHFFLGKQKFASEFFCPWHKVSTQKEHILF